MSVVLRRGHYYVTQYVTGPQYLVLMLDLQPERIDDPFVTAPKEPSSKYGLF